MQSITRQELEQMNDIDRDDFVLINVLPRETFEKQHIRTSINIPYENSDFIDTVESVAGDKDRKIVVYCANFDCPVSNKAADALEQAGFKSIYDYEGGTEDWLTNH
ncbi:rhodanese-like domain-containing protein [Marinobacterium sp. D7]|uniref:rhodanese-like domain-containing protein n=1 Tax=Marinobacterium ramblicola TaxID=2849041 RepID=UPI001C2CFDBA|nr:rhodanese-like domain-containing protein [Marinobacterium ramblicola]MBV1786650.1 rhodanese-like domain-containing protein [Marinobacterium ramblicola]